MAYIKERPSKDGKRISYLITVSQGRDAEGNKIVFNTTFVPKSKKPEKWRTEAEVFAEKFQEQVENGEVVSGDRVTFNEFVEIWKKNWLPAKTPTVRDHYEDVLRVRVLPVIGHMKMTKIRATHIDKILEDEKAEGKAPKTVRMTFTVINSVFRYALKKQYIRENPCVRCDDLPPITMKTGNDLSFFTKDQADRFLKDALTREYSFAFKGHHRTLKKTGEEYVVPEYVERHSIPLQWQAYFRMAIDGGFRRGEMCALTWRDIEFTKRIASITKAIANTKDGQIVKDPKSSAGIRDIVLSKATMSSLKQWKKEQRSLCMKLGTAWEGHRDVVKDGKTVDSFDDNYIFIQIDNGRPIHLSTPGHKFAEVIDLYNSSIEKEAERISNKAERQKKLDERLPKIRLHDLRHTMATLLRSKGVPIETISRRLGHSKTSVTWDIYDHALPEDDKRASEVMEEMFG